MKRDLIISNPKRRSIEQLKKLQSLPLEQKVNLSLRRIKQFYTQMDGKTYISFSGGKDSTVMLDLVRQIDPYCEAVFVDTGLEFESIRDFVKTKKHVTIIRPKMLFNEVIEKYGYPVISKEVSMGVSRYRNTTSDVQKDLRLNGGINPTSGRPQQRTIPIKNHFLVDAPFKISERCCDIMKKNPAKDYMKKSGKFPFIGTMAEESQPRRLKWLSSGCNIYTGGIPQSNPLSFWTEKDIWDYLGSRKLDYADVYDKGADRTGCVFCMFGYWSKNDHNTKNDRMELLRRVDPIKYNYCMKDKEDGGLGLRKVINHIDKELNIKKDGQQLFDWYKKEN